MKNQNYKDNNSRQRLPTIARTFELMAIMALVVVSIGLFGTRASSAPIKKQPESSIVAKCKADLAKRLKLPAQSIKVVETQATLWPDASLGIPEIDKVYAESITPGARVILEARSSRYLYTTSAKAFRYGGPVSIWSYSMLYVKPVQNEPNLNGDLYQCSLLGTNNVRILSGVTDYYPQENGMVIVKQRTSRSGHELLYVKADGSVKANTLQSAFDFGEAAFNKSQDKWAGFVRPAVGSAWTIVVADIRKDSASPQTLSLPDGAKPGRIAWSGDMLMILVPKGERTVCLETSPKASTLEWKEVSSHVFPGLTDFMLNKSETLEISQVTNDGKQSVEVARVWFTGDRNVIAKISGLTLREYDLIGPYAFILGEKDSKPIVYIVDISTGETIPSLSGISRDVKPFLYPPHQNPMTLDKS